MLEFDSSDDFSSSESFNINFNYPYLGYGREVNVDHNCIPPFSLTASVSYTNCAYDNSAKTDNSSDKNCVHLSHENSNIVQSPEISTKDVKTSPQSPDEVVECYKGLVSEFKGCIVIT